MKLATSEERVKLLKNGIERKTIEQLYIQYNRLKIIKNPILFDFTEAPLQDRIYSSESQAMESERTGQRTGKDMISMSVLADTS